MRPTEAALGIALPLALSGCLPPFPAAVPVDLDGDGISTEDGDCNDADPDVHPGVDECALLLEESTDHDCDGYFDGGALPVVDEFDDGLLLGWSRPAETTPIVVREQDGAVHQLASGYLTIVKEDGAECWQDLDVTYQLRPGLAGELMCWFYLRTTGMGRHADTHSPDGYAFFLHHHSRDMDGILASDGVIDDWDGWVYPHMGRLEGYIRPLEQMIGSDDSHSTPYPGDEHFTAASDDYWVNLTARETDEGTELTCRYATEDPSTGGTYLGCFPDQPDLFAIVDSDPTRPLTGGVGVRCDWCNFNYQDIGEDPFAPSARLGVAIERVEIRRALR